MTLTLTAFLGVQTAIGLGRRLAFLDAAALADALHGDVARLSRRQVADVEIHLRPTGALQPFGQHGMNLDLLGRAVAGIGDRQNEGGRFADQNLRRSLRLEDQLRLTHLDAHDRRAGERHPRLRRHVAFLLGKQFHLQDLLLLGLQGAQLPHEDILFGDRFGFGIGATEAIGHANADQNLLNRDAASVAHDQAVTARLADLGRRRSHPFQADRRFLPARRIIGRDGRIGRWLLVGGRRAGRGSFVRCTWLGNAAQWR